MRNSSKDSLRICCCSPFLEAATAVPPAAPAGANGDSANSGKLALVNLYRALSGGWNLSDPQWTSTSGAPAATQNPSP
jgi:hypothetical protein